MASNQKFDQGLEHIKNAEKCMKTSLLKWRPDFDIAADEYAKASVCFRNAKAFEQCKDCLIKAADCNKQNRSLFHAAKNYEQAIIACKEMGDLRDVLMLAEKSCNLYQQHGSCDSGAAALDKGAKIIELQFPDQALRLYQKACDVVMIEDNPRQGAEYASKVARIMVKLGMYDQATDAIRREIGMHQQNESTGAIGRLAVALVLVQLARGDTVAAEKAFKEWGNCCDPEEVQTLEMLLQGFDEEDPEMAARALSSSFIKHMDVAYSKLARDLPLPKGTAPLSSKASVVEKAAPSYISPNKGSAEAGASASGGNDEDEDEGGHGLC